MDILDVLLASPTLAKIIRLFYLNPEEVFEVRDITHHTKSSSSRVRRDLKLFKKIGFIKSGVKKVEIHFSAKGGSASGGKSKRKKPEKKTVRGMQINESFALFHPLKNFILNTAPLERDKLLSKIKGVGRLKMILLSGIFMNVEDTNESRIDMLIVGDAIKKRILENTLHAIEAKIGKELNYAVLSTEEFLYRFGMYDKFVHDILEAPHEKLLNKLDV